MGISLKKRSGTQSLEEIKEEIQFWNDWTQTKYQNGDWGSTIELNIDERLLMFLGDSITTEHIPVLGKILAKDNGLTEEERSYIRGLIKDVEEDTQQQKEDERDYLWGYTTQAQPQSPTPDGMIDVVDSLRNELEQAYRRIRVLEAVQPPTEDQQEEEEDNGRWRKGFLSLSCTQCLDAFTMLLTVATGKQIRLPEGDTETRDAIAKLYSMVSGKQLTTCKSYIRQRDLPEKQTLHGEKEKKVRESIEELLRLLGVR